MADGVLVSGVSSGGITPFEKIDREPLDAGGVAQAIGNAAVGPGGGISAPTPNLLPKGRTLLDNIASGLGVSSERGKSTVTDAGAVTYYEGNTSDSILGFIRYKPRTLDFGNVVGKKEKILEIWNAHRDGARTLDSAVFGAGAEGIEFEGPFPIPFDLNIMQLIEATVRALPDGPAIIDGDLTLNFSSPAEAAVVALLGRRVGSLLVPPEVPVREMLQSKTDILRKLSGKEQRIARRKQPRQVVAYRYLLDGRDRRRLEAVLFANQGGRVLIPIWWEQALSVAPITAGATSITVDSVDYADFRENDFIVLHSDDVGQESVSVTTIVGNTINLGDPVAKNYPAGALVMPARVTQMRSAASGSRYRVAVLDVQAEFHVLDNDIEIADTSAFNALNGKVFLDDPNYVDGTMSEAYRQRTQQLDSLSGLFSVRSPWSRHQRETVKTFITHSRQELWETRQLLHALNGMQQSFYLPTFFDDLLPVQDLLIGESKIVVENAGFAVFVNGVSPRNRIRVVLLDGTTVSRVVVGGTEIDEATEEIEVDSSWASTIPVSSIERIEFVELSRINTDGVVIDHADALGNATISVPVTAVFDE